MKRLQLGVVLAGVGLVAIGTLAWGNGGPFIVKDPNGDPAAKGVLARLDPSLMPAREKRLKVVKEDLSIDIGVLVYPLTSGPIASVTAEYKIENPTDETVAMHFGFPILRGIYVQSWGMGGSEPAVAVTVDGTRAGVKIVSNSIILGMIRQQARQTIDKAIADDAKLAALVKAVPHVPAARATPASDPTVAAPGGFYRALADKATERLREYVADTLKWNDRDAALLAAYASIDLGSPTTPHVVFMRADFGSVAYENLGFLGAIGEQRATQLFAALAAKFDPKAAAGYEEIFKAWGGDVRERAIDVADGKLRPRELDLPPNPARVPTDFDAGDPAVYARVDFLDKHNLSDAAKDTCKTVLKNLPVTFTFAPMNLLYYQVDFPAKSKRVVTVSYKQYCFVDTKQPKTCQLAYVLHPASLWDSFGPINLKVTVPQGAKLVASTPIKKQNPAATAPQAQQSQPIANSPPTSATLPLAPKPVDTYTATLTEAKDKTGELFIAVEQAAFESNERVSPK